MNTQKDILPERPRILMITPAFAPLANPEAIVNAKLALAFMKQGWHIDIVSRKLDDMTDYQYGSTWEEPWEPLREHTYEVSYPRGGKFKRILETMWGALLLRYPIEGCRWALHAYRKAMQLHAANNYDLILSRALPDSAHLPALALAKKSGVVWIANWNDPPALKMPPPYGKGSEASLGFWHEKLIKSVVHSSSWITFPSKRLLAYMGRCLGEEIVNKSSVIPHIASNRAIRDRKLTSEKLSFAYAGNLTVERSPKTFLQAFRSFLDKTDHPEEIELIFIGRDSTGLIEEAYNNGLKKNINLLGSLGYEACQLQLESCDVLLIIEAPTEEGIFLPSKFVDYLQLGKPILGISPERSTVADYLIEYGGGLAADCRSVGMIEDALVAIYSHWKKGVLQEKFDTEKLSDAFSSQAILAQYINIINGLSEQEKDEEVVKV